MPQAQVSTCQCVLPDGARKLFCPRHKCDKYTRDVEICQLGSKGEDPRARRYWDAWEQGKGPRQREPEKASDTKPTGPGTELKKIFVSIGIIGCKTGIECANLIKRMNAWGVEGCREHKEEILAELRQRQSAYGWLDKLKAAALSVTTGLAFVVDWSDPFPGIVDEAIRRATATT